MGQLVSRALVLVLVAACAKRAPAPPEPPEAPVPGEVVTAGPSTSVAKKQWPGTDAEYALYRALSVKDGEPDCAQVEALVPEPAESLTFLAEDIPMPPWVGIRAATCLVLGHAADAPVTLRDWVVREERKGLALLTLQMVDDMPEDVAVEVVRDALSGPFAAQAAEAAAGSEYQAVRDLAP